MNPNSRIKLEDSVLEMIIKLAEGNPGAVKVITALLEQGGKIDTADFLGGIGKLLMLDSYGIYGSKIWVLFKEVCGEDVEKTVAVLRAMQLGLTPSSSVLDALSDPRTKSKTINPADLLTKVKEHLGTAWVSPQAAT